MTHASKVAYMVVLSLALVACQDGQNYDTLIVNGLIYNGTGGEPLLADIAIKNGKIAEIGPELNGEAAQVIDAARRVVAPGFIDVHAHIEPLPLHPEAESFIRQGVTTVIGGPDGSSPLPIREYLDSLEEMGVGVNTAYLVGHGSVRADVMALEDRVPNPDEMDQMKGIVRESMEGGAYGISTGLKYLPGTFASVEEVVELAQVAGAMGGIYTSHMRDEGLKIIEGVEEIIHISREADIPVVLTHHKIIGNPMWGSSTRTLAMVDSARDAGLNVMIDQYPYTASYTSIAVLIPPWALEGGRITSFRERCQDPVLRDSIKKGITFNIKYDRGGNDLSRVQLARFDWKPELVGRTLYDWAIEEGMEPTAENGAELVIQAQINGSASCIYHVIDEGDVKRIMQHPWTMHASDGRLSILNAGHPHPRAFGAFPRVLGHYVRELGVLDLATAIHKMTGLPAMLMGFDDRGQLQPGYHADITIFDAAKVIDKATFEDPNQYPEGIDWVLVNGEVAFSSESGFENSRHGEVLRGPAYKN